jgi:3-hydroxybutyryl-CoA dehydratase
MSPLDAGDAVPPFVVESVSAEGMRTIAALLQDPTPIHFAPEVVAELGMGDRVINQGPANLGYVLNALLLAAPDRRIEHFRVSFQANVLAEDRAVAGGTVVERDDATTQCEVWLDVDGRGRALEGVARLGQPLTPMPEST